MPKRGDDYGVLLAGGILLGIGLLAASGKKESAEQRRQKFELEVSEGLASLGLKLEGLALGRGRQNEPFWQVLVQAPGGPLWKVSVRLSVGAEPYGSQVPALVLAKIRAQLEANSGDRG